MKKEISLLCVLGLSAGLGVAQEQPAVTPDFVMGNNDLDKDGIITRDEATKAGRQLAQRWDFFDTNKDGKVDMAEVKAGLGARQGSVASPPTSEPPAKAPAAGAASTKSAPAPTKSAPAPTKKPVGAAAPSAQTSAKSPAPAPKQ